jgi:pyruvate/2-oxoglutarate dehydrogenase complex dihydrolipoamide acyltransferase (E2) component
MVIPITIPRYIALLKNYASKPRITKWLKEDGQSVEKDETLVIVETTKASLEVPAPASGLVFHLRKVRDIANIGDTVGVIASSSAEFEAFKKDPQEIEPVAVGNV